MIYLYYDRKKMELNSSAWNGNLARVIKILVLDDEISSLKKKYRSFLEKRKKKKKLRFERFDKPYYIEQENFFSKWK